MIVEVGDTDHDGHELPEIDCRDGDAYFIGRDVAQGKIIVDDFVAARRPVLPAHDDATEDMRGLILADGFVANLGSFFEKVVAGFFVANVAQKYRFLSELVGEIQVLKARSLL